MNVVRLVRIESGYPNPCDNWYLKSTLLGRAWIKENTSVSTAANQNMINTHSQLDFSLVHHAMFQARATVMFWGTFCKSNLYPSMSNEFYSDKQFITTDFVSRW